MSRLIYISSNGNFGKTALIAYFSSIKVLLLWFYFFHIEAKLLSEAKMFLCELLLQWKTIFFNVTYPIQDLKST